ncbi:AAA family ATPase [Halobacillus yeomjeoni]|uniref:P-loop NTPase n=1 Tax=Halobacillus yeomjeoni TaxID=311194 RepID=A0A931HTQ2_9BACI|nr:P-loop NTPase [Halobacillus yeomjeoni]MBH0229189.1 P-loop NTPase [Halobacillus yeomjeoni]
MTGETMHHQPSKRKRGEMIAVCSAKGGVGRTTLTVNLAISLFKKNIKVGILDGDFQFGDIGLALDLQSTFSMKDVMEEIENIDEFSLGNYLCSHESGVKVLPAPERPEYADLVTKERVNRVIDLLLQQLDYLVVDTGVGLQEHTIDLIEKADQILIVTNLEMATLKNTKLLIETLEVLGLSHKVQLVINRADMESVIGANDVKDILNIEDPIYIPNNFQVASQSLNIGIPFVINQGKTDIAKSFFRMAEQLTSRREISFIKEKNPNVLSKLLGFKLGKGGSYE